MYRYRIAKDSLYKYGVAFFFTGLALLLTWLTWPVAKDAPFLFFLAAVVLSTWRGGLGPGMMSAAIAILSADFFLFEPRWAVVTRPVYLLQFAIFSLIAFLISWLVNKRIQTEHSLRDLRDELAVILDTVGDGITAQDANGQPVFANMAAARLAGYSTPEAMIRTPMTDARRKVELYDEQGEPLLFSALPRSHVFKYGESASRTFRMRFSDTGEEKWIHLTSSPMFDEHGKVKLAVNIFRDITEQMQSNLDLVRYAAIIRNSSDAILSKSVDGVITSWNPGAEQLYGYTAEEAVGQHVSMIFPDDIRASEIQLMDRIKTGGKVEHYETRRVCKDGREVDIWLTISPIRTAAGQLMGYSAIGHDITVRKQVETLRQETQERLRTLMDNLAAFVGVMTPDGILIEANRTALTAAGLQPEDVLNKPFDEAYWWSFSEESQARLRSTIEKAAQGETLRYDVDVRVADNRFITIDFMLAPVFDEQDQVQYLIPSGIDVTERNRLMQQLEQEKLRITTILNAVPGIVYQGSGDTDFGRQHMDFISQYAEAMLGYPPEESDATPNFWKQVTHPEDWETMVKHTNEAYAEDSPSPVLFRCITKDGQILHVESYNAVIRDNWDRHLGTCGIVLNVTERRLREQEIMRLTSTIASQSQRLDSIISNVPGVIFDTTFDVDKGEQTLNFISDYVEKMLGYSPDEWRSDPHFWQKIVVPEDWESARRDTATFFENDSPGSTQFRCYSASGETVFTESFFNFLKNGTQVRVLGVIMDITQRKAAEEALTHYTDELRRSNEELEQFAYVASHDLQEPLRMVSSYLQLIEQRYTERLDDDGREFINFAVDGATRMKALINDLLTYSRVQRDTSEFTNVSMAQVLEKVLYDLQITIEDTGAVITYDELPEIVANEGQMIQLCQNLIANAIKFRKDQPPLIHIGVSRGHRQWEFCVKDNGIGIDPDYQERIFTIFQRLHTQQDYPGTGIGLAICQKVVNKHHGKIWVESQPGEGATFYFTIPLKPRKKVGFEYASRRNLTGRG